MTVILSSVKPDRRLIDFVHRLQDLMDCQVVLVFGNSKFVGMDGMDELMMSGCSFIMQSDTEDAIFALQRAFSHVLRNSEEQTGVIVANADGVNPPTEIVRVANALFEQKNGIIISRPAHAGHTFVEDRLYAAAFRYLRYMITATVLQNGKLGICGISINLLPSIAALNIEHFESEFEEQLKSCPLACSIQLLPSVVYPVSMPKLSFHHRMQQSVFLLLLLRFCLSGILSAAIDFGLLFVVQIWSENLFVAVLTARTVSSIFNFIFNRTLVFHSTAKQRKGKKELIQVLHACSRYAGY